MPRAPDATLSRVSEPELLELPDRAAWRRWLSRNHGRGRGVWLVIHKQGATTGSLTYEDAVREALCFGWIDSTAGSIDGERYRQWMAPRKPGSGWSATNKARVAAAPRCPTGRPTASEHGVARKRAAARAVTF